MPPITLILPTEHYSNGSLIYEFAICSCFIDYTLFTLQKKKSLVDFIEGIKNISKRRFVDSFFGTYIICCFDFINFAAKTNDGRLYSACMQSCLLEYPDPFSCNCLDLDFDDEDEDEICFYCEKTISSFLLQELHLIIISEREEEEEESD